MSKLWECLEALGEVGAAAAEWEQWTGGDFEMFKGAFLQKANRVAGSYPCPRCGDSHKVHPVGDGSYVGLFRGEEDVGCDDFDLTAEQVAVWELNRAGLCRALARALGCDARGEPYAVAGIWEVGTIRARGVVVLLCLLNARDEFRGSVAELSGRVRGRYLLIAPTTGFMDLGCRELLANVGAEFVDMETHIVLTDGGDLEASAEALALVGQLMQRPEGSNQAPEEAERMHAYRIRQESTRRRKGKHDRTPVSTWRIWFEGREILMPTSVGTEYLVFLIRNQGKEFAADVLTERVRGSKPGAGEVNRKAAMETLRDDDGGGDEGETLHGRVGELNERDVIWDGGQIAECLRKVKGLKGEIQQHETAKDFSSDGSRNLKAKLEEQEDLLAANAKKVKGKWVPKEYQKGTFQDKGDLIRKHFRKLLDGHLRENCRPLFDHLNDRSTLDYGVRNRYRPKPRIEWRFI